MIDKSKAIYENRAKINSKANETYRDTTDYECCMEDLVFAMKDNYHEFSIGLTTILECLDIAQREGYIPKLPDEWWIDISNHN